MNRSLHLLTLIALTACSGADTAEEQNDAITEVVTEALPEPVAVEDIFSKIPNKPSKMSLLLGISGPQGYQTFLINPPSSANEKLFMVPYLVLPGEEGYSLYLHDSLSASFEYGGSGATYNAEIPIHIEEPGSWYDGMMKLVDHSNQYFAEFKSYARDWGEDPMPWEFQSREEISFISPSYVTRDYNHYEFSGGAHGSAAFGRYTAALNDEENTRLIAQDYYPDSDIRAAKQELLKKFDNGEFFEMDYESGWNEDEMDPPDMEELEMTLAWRDGKLRAEAHAHSSVPYFMSPTYSLSVSADLGLVPDQILAQEELPVEFPVLKSSIDALFNVVLSPSGDYMVVVKKDAIDVYDVEKKERYATDRSYSVQVVMVEWLSAEEAADATEYFDWLYSNDLNNMLDEMRRELKNERERANEDRLGHVLERIPSEWHKITKLEEEGWVIYNPGIVQNPTVFIKPKSEDEYEVYLAVGQDGVSYTIIDYIERDDGSFTVYTDNDEEISFSWADDEQRLAYWFFPRFTDDEDWKFVAEEWVDLYEEVTEEVTEEDL